MKICLTIFTNYECLREIMEYTVQFKCEHTYILHYTLVLRFSQLEFNVYLSVNTSFVIWFTLKMASELFAETVKYLQ